MLRIYLRLILLLALASWPAHSKVMYVEAAAGGGATELYSQDFEPTNTCANNDVDDEAGTPNCQYATSPAPLAGSFSLYLDAVDDAAATHVQWDDDFVCDAGVICRVMFLFHIDDNGLSGIDTTVRMGVSGSRVLDMRWRGDADWIDCRTDDITGADVTTSNNTTYKICMEYDLTNDDGVVYVDPSGGTYCSGSTGSSTCDDTVTDHTQFDSLNFQAGTSRANHIIDNIVVEEE